MKVIQVFPGGGEAAFNSACLTRCFEDAQAVRHLLFNQQTGAPNVQI